MILIVPTLFSMFKSLGVSNFLTLAIIHDKLSENQKKYFVFFCDLESVGRISPSKFPLKLRTFTQKLSGISFQILFQITELSEYGFDPVWIWMQELVDKIIFEKL